MRCDFFTIPVQGGEAEAEALNRHLAAARILSVERQFVADGARAPGIGADPAGGTASSAVDRGTTPRATSARRIATGTMPGTRTTPWASAVPELTTGRDIPDLTRRRPGSLLLGGGPDPKIAGALVGGRTQADGPPAVAPCHAPAPPGTGRA